jgi:hypothetical protein
VDEQTLRYNGTTLTANSFLANNGTKLKVNSPVSPGAVVNIRAGNPGTGNEAALSIETGGGDFLNMGPHHFGAGGEIGFNNAASSAAALYLRAAALFQTALYLRAFGAGFNIDSRDGSDVTRLTLHSDGDMTFTPASGKAGLRVARITAASVSSPQQGMIIFDTTTGKFQGYDGTNWVDLS